MKLIDLTHVIEPGMPVFPGTEPPRMDVAATIAKDGFAEKCLSMVSHTGTHMDAPAHMRPRGKTLDRFSVSDFQGRAVMADARACRSGRIGVDRLRPLENFLKDARFLILRTGWEERWGRKDYFDGFPALTPEAARYAISLGIRGIGVDAISVDRMEDRDFPIHGLLFDADVLVIENLANLDKVGAEFDLVCFPLRIADADGSPARAVAFVGA
jgi:arylformamidase